MGGVNATTWTVHDRGRWDAVITTETGELIGVVALGHGDLVARSPRMRELLRRLVAGWDGTGSISDVVADAREVLAEIDAGAA